MNWIAYSCRESEVDSFPILWGTDCHPRSILTVFWLHFPKFQNIRQWVPHKSFVSAKVLQSQYFCQRWSSALYRHRLIPFLFSLNYGYFTLFQSQYLVNRSRCFTLTENIVDLAEYTLKSVNWLCYCCVNQMIIVDVLLSQAFHLQGVQVDV